MNNKLLKACSLLSLSFLTLTAAYSADGVRLITQADVLAGGITPGDAPGYPATLSRPGSYRLASNLHVSNANTHAVDITTDNVTFDLNGFIIQGPGISGSGVGVRALKPVLGDVGRSNIAVRNGTIAGMGSFGVIVGAGSHIQDLRIEGNKTSGIVVTGSADGCLISDNSVTNNFENGIWASASSCNVVNNTVSANGGVGVWVGEAGIVKGNVVFNNGNFGVLVVDGGLAVGNTIRKNALFGLSASASTGYRENIITFNNGNETGPQVDGGVQIGANLCGTSTTCP